MAVVDEVVCSAKDRAVQGKVFLAPQIEVRLAAAVDSVAVVTANYVWPATLEKALVVTTLAQRLARFHTWLKTQWVSVQDKLRSTNILITRPADHVTS